MSCSSSELTLSVIDSASSTSDFSTPSESSLFVSSLFVSSASLISEALFISSLVMSSSFWLESVTSTAHCAMYPPSLVVTVIVAFPFAMPVTSPSSTLAIASSDDDHSRSLLVASAGYTVADNDAFCPTSISRLSLSSTTDETATA